MIIYKDNEKLLDTEQHGLNIGVLNFNDYQGAMEKLIKTDSFAFNDSHIYTPNTYQGYSTSIDTLVRISLKNEFLRAIRDGNEISLPKEKNRYRKYYIDGNIQTTYYNADYVKLTIPIYFEAFVYERVVNTFYVRKGVIESINNLGDIYAEPTYIIRGSGDLIFSVNGVINTLRNATDGYIVACQSKEQNVMNLSEEFKNVTSQYNGVYPTLKIGYNKVQLIKGDSLEVQVSWRYRD